MKFLRNLLATIVGLFLFTFIIFLMIIAIASSADKLEEVEENSILTLKMNMPIAERSVEDPFAEIFGEQNAIGINDIKKALEHAKTDDKIKGLYIQQGFFSSGLAKLEELREAVEDFKESGKFVVAYGEYYSEPGYYIASVADEIYLNPRGDLSFDGFLAEVTYFKGMWDKLDIEWQLFRPESNIYKSAVEPFTRTDMSEDNREQISELIGSIRSNLMDNISSSRGIELDELNMIMDSMKIRFAGDAVELGMADDTIYFDQVEDIFREKLALEEDDKLEYIGIGKYNNSYKDKNKSKNRIAVIVGEGSITSGKSEDGNIGSDSFAKLIRDARKNDKVKAVVIRVNSPGGSALASDVIWREVIKTSEVKPVIASMSDVAASGGYYIAMGADTIVAEPNTITGSIGIFGMIPDFSGFLNNKLGITHDRVKSGAHPDLYTVTRPLTAGEKAIIQNDVEEGYQNFTKKAAQGRDMQVDELLEIAGGRVWTGTQAKERGLVDILGGLEDAVEIAATKAGVEDDYILVYYPEKKDFFEKLMSDLSGGARAWIIKNELGEFYPIAKKIEEINKMRGVQARMPYDIELK